MNPLFTRWLPAGVLAIGVIFTVAIDTQREMKLREPLATTIPAVMWDYGSEDVEVPKAEQRVAGMSDYLMRMFTARDTAAAAIPGFSLYVGYYESQTQGKLIHSPKNCLPGAGWEALTSTRETLATADGPVTVNRYLIQSGPDRALVLYWYQGRGRIEANEYRVKWDLLRDAAFRQRSDEALVRVIVPVTTSEEDAFQLASRIATTVIPGVHKALPAA